MVTDNIINIKNINQFNSVKSYLKKTEVKINKINFNLVLISAVIAITPDLDLFFPKPILIGIILCWYVDIFFLEKQKIRGGLKTFLLVILIWFGYELIIRALGFGDADIGNYFNRLFYFDIVIKSIYIGRYYSSNQKNHLFRILQCIIILNIIYILYVSNLFPEIYFSESIEPIELLGFNRPSAVFYNMLAFFIGLCFFDFLKCRNKLIRSMDVISIIICYIFMLTCEPRATSLAFSILLIMGSLYAFNKMNAKATLMTVLCVPIVIIILYVSRDQLISFLPERIAIRYLALLGDSGGDEKTLARIPLLMNSLSSFVSHPIFGTGNYIGIEYYHIIGQHSLIPDFLGAYGLIGLSFLFYFFPTLYSLIKNSIKVKYFKSYWLYAFLVYLLYSFNSNTFYAQLAVTAFMMLACVETKKTN